MDSIFAAIPAAAAISFLAIREAWRAWQPARHLLAGDYEEARTSAEALGQSWMRVIPGIRVSARYAVAASLHLMGQLEESLEATAGVDRAKLREPTRYDFDSLDAASLVLLDREPERVIALLGARAPRPPEDLVLEALARQALGEETSLPAKPPERGDRVAIFHYLCGLHALRAGDSARATSSFRLAADSAHANVYTRRARAFFEQPSSEDVAEAPSSLAPQVVATARE